MRNLNDDVSQLGEDEMPTQVEDLKKLVEI